MKAEKRHAIGKMLAKYSPLVHIVEKMEKIREVDIKFFFLMMAFAVVLIISSNESKYFILCYSYHVKTVL